MSSMQRSTFTLTASVDDTSTPVPSDAYEVPKGVGVGGVFVVTALDTGGDFDGGTVGAIIQATNQANATDDAPASGASWETIGGGTLTPAEAATAAYLGDGNLTVDLSPCRWIRLLPVVGGTPVNIALSAYGKFDYWKG